MVSHIQNVRATLAVALLESSPRGVHLSTAVILSAAKDLSLERGQILRCAQDDGWNITHRQELVLQSAQTQSSRSEPTLECSEGMTDGGRPLAVNPFQRRRFASQTKPIQNCHPERSEGSFAGQIQNCHPERSEGSFAGQIQNCHPECSEGSFAGQRSFAALGMTKRDGLFIEMYCPLRFPGIPKILCPEIGENLAKFSPI